jgi:uncharacterized iron-regulated membrane protein
MANRQALRRAWWQIHKWLGLFLMALLIPMGLSGVVLAWDDAIDHGLNPQRYAVHSEPALPPSTYAVAAAKSLGSDERLSQIRYPDSEGPVVAQAIRVSATTPHGKGRHAGRTPPQRATVWLDPASGRVLDVMRGDTGLIRVAHNFHGMLFIPGGPGRALIGLVGIAMFLMAAGGVWLWWPPVGQWVKGLRWQRGDRKLDTNLHHRIGFWIALPLAAQAFTGVWMAWPQMMAVAGLAPKHVGPMERARMVPNTDTRLTPDQALAAAEAGQEGRVVSLAWPVGSDGPWRVTLRGKGGGEWLVDDATGSAKPAPPRADGGLALAVRHYHDGTTLGPVWRVLMLLWGLAPTALGITGLSMWLRSRRWRKQATKRTRKERAPVAAA